MLRYMPDIRFFPCVLTGKYEQQPVPVAVRSKA